MKVAFKDPSFAFEFVRNLGFMYYGGSDLGEMMATAGRITEGDFESWFTEWDKVGQRTLSRADASLASGHRESARTSYLRASTYFRTAEFYLHGNPADPRNSAKADEAVEEIRKAGGRAVAMAADISRPDDVKQLFVKGKEAFGHIDAVVNTAGIMPLAPIAKGDIDSFDKVIAINLRGSYLIMSEAANHVVDGGRIVLFSSSVVGKNFPGYGAYIASKEGVEGLTRVLANELGQRKITVNAVSPGPVATELFLKGKSEEQIEAITKMVPLGRIGEVGDIEVVVAFLVSKEGGWINGQVLRVNGGYV